MLSVFPTTFHWKLSLEQWISLREKIVQSCHTLLGDGITYSDESPPPPTVGGPARLAGDRFWLTLTPHGWLLCFWEGEGERSSPASGHGRKRSPLGTATVTLEGDTITAWMERRLWSVSALGIPPRVTPGILQGLIQRLMHPAHPSAEALAIACPVPERDRAWEKLHHGLIHRLVQGIEELPQIIHWGLSQAQRLLDVDRILIYQFQVQLQSLKIWRGSEPFQGEHLHHRPPYRSQWNDLQDGVTYEARRGHWIPSVLYRGGEAALLGRKAEVEEPSEGQPEGLPTGAIADAWGDDQPTPAGRLPIARAQLAAAIAGHTTAGDPPWGLLVAQTVDQARHWSEREEMGLTRLAQILTLGIYYGQMEASGKQHQQRMEQTLQDQGEALQAALTQAQIAAHAKQEFLAAVSHELRTPLTCIIGLSDTLLRWSLDNLSPKQNHYLHTIHDSGEHLKRLVDDILEITQLESGLASLQIQEFSLTRLILHTVSLVQDQSPRGSRSIVKDLQLGSVEDHFWGDRQRIQQIIFNLLSNAVKFTPEPGPIILRAWRDNGGVLLEVEDTGIGIPAEQLPLLFETFHQLENSYQRVHGGLGMGLALVKQLAALHGGTVEVRSVLHQGSVFTVWLPDQRGRVIAGEGDRSDAHPGQTTDQRLVETAVDVAGHESAGQSQRKSVLLIDSNDERALSLCDLLVAANHDVVWLEDGAMAIAQFDTIRPNLVVLGLDSPGAPDDPQAGMEPLMILPDLRQRAGQRLKILTLGKGEIEAVDEVLERGQIQHRALALGGTLGDRPLIDAHLSQPIAPQTFIETVMALLGQPPSAVGADSPLQPALEGPEEGTMGDILTKIEEH